MGTLTGMPFDLSWEPEGVYRRYWGDVTIAQRRRSLELICADPRFDSLEYAITDYLGVHDYEITAEATMEIASLHVGPIYTNPRIVIAAVVTDARITAAIEHFIGLGMVTVPYGIFPDALAAREWIAQKPRKLALKRPRF